MIVFHKNVKYMVAENAYRRLSDSITINYSYDCEYYAIDKETRMMTAKRGCAWDGATKFPDRGWILEGSLWHDILHWLIARGAIPESDNDLIDRELAIIIREEGGSKGDSWLSRKMLKFRSKYVEFATNLANEKKGNKIPAYCLQKGKITKVR